MAKTYEELLEQAAIIRDETAAGKNTAERVGGTITDAVDYVKELQDTYAGIHAEAAEAKTEAAAAKLTAAEAKTESAQAVSTAQAAQTKNAEQDNRLANAEEQNTKQNERLLNYVYPKLYQLNEGAGSRVFNGFTKDGGVGSLINPKDTYRYSVLYSTTQKQFVLNVTDEASGVGVRVGTFTFWPEIILPNGSRIASSESYALRDCLYYIYVEGEGSTYYHIDSNGVASEKSATYLLRLLANKNAAAIATNTKEIARVNSTATQAQEDAGRAQEAANTAQIAAQEAKDSADTKVTELAEKVNGKQDALTLTVKDNGNIVLANIQGQSKEFMPATPSGDPMHYAFVTAGAEYNDTGADIVKDAPWADLADDDADKTVIHKAGYWYLNGLGDITNEQMQRIYMLTGSNQNYWNSYCCGQDLRTNIMTINENADVATNLMTAVGGFRRCTIEVIKVPNYKLFTDSFPLFNLLYVEKLKFIIGMCNASKDILGRYIYNLKGIKIFGLYASATFSDAKNLSMKSVLYMINNEAATSPITITLHADVYNRCMANEDILAALEAHTNISIASA